MAKYVFDYRLYSKILDRIQVLGQFVFFLLFCGMAIYLAPGIGMIFSLLVSIYFLYVLITELNALIYYYPSKITIVEQQLILEFIFGRKEIIHISRLESLSRGSKKDKVYMSFKIMDRKQDIVIGRHFNSQQQFIELIQNLNPDCVIQDLKKN